jgi:peptidoglycan/xylan/chitin deacetylase (PgdA/CDA1 family)
VLKSQRSFSGNTKAAVTFSIDDCLEDASLIMFELLKDFHVHGTFNVIADFVGRKVERRFADWNLLREIAKNDNELASHSLTHKTLNRSMGPRLKKLVNAVRYENPIRLSWRIFSLLAQNQIISDVEHFSLQEELRVSRERIQEKAGITCNAYVYPGGGYDERYKHMVMQAGYTSARSGYIGYNLPWNLDVFALKVQVWDSKVTEKTAKQWVDKALSCNCWLIEVIHKVDCPNDLYSANLSDLRSHLRYVADKKNDFWISTQSEIAGFLSCGQGIKKRDLQ